MHATTIATTSVRILFALIHGCQPGAGSVEGFKPKSGGGMTTDAALAVAVPDNDEVCADNPLVRFLKGGLTPVERFPRAI